jgi:hypothetical protein
MDQWVSSQSLAAGSRELEEAVAAALGSDAALQRALGEGLKKHEDLALSLLPGMVEGYLKGEASCEALLAQLPEQHAPPQPSHEDEVRLSPMNVFPDRLLPASSLPPPAAAAPVYASVPSVLLLRAGLAACLARFSHFPPSSRTALVRCAAVAAERAELDEASWRLVLLALHRCAAAGTPGAVSVIQRVHRREDNAALRLAAAALLLRHPQAEPDKAKDELVEL